MTQEVKKFPLLAEANLLKPTPPQQLINEAERKRLIREPIPLPNKKYACIVMDQPMADQEDSHELSDQTK